MYEAQTRLGIELPPEQFNTLTGFVLFLFDRVPTVGERTQWDGWSFEVVEISGFRVSKLIARRTPTANRGDRN